jgi:hypothetical protein
VTTGRAWLASGQRADVAQERLDPKRCARGLLDQGESVNPASMAVHVIGELALNGNHFTPSQILLTRPQVGLQRLP